MFYKYLSVFSLLCLFSLTGCISNNEPGPKMGTPGPIDLDDIQPITSTPKYTPKPSNSRIPASWIPAKWRERKWEAIVIHHSATDKGNMAIFDRWHRENNHWDGVGYHFVIGNGTDSGNGQVEVTFRWTNQKTGAHCGGTPGNWANVSGVGICLVGNFNKTAPSPAQMRSLKKLVNFLKKRYNVPNSKILGHGQVHGTSTDCPGKKFPMYQVK